MCRPTFHLVLPFDRCLPVVLSADPRRYALRPIRYSAENAKVGQARIRHIPASFRSHPSEFLIRSECPRGKGSWQVAVLNPTFGEWLRARRRVFDLTQSELAERVGCAEDTIGRI